VNQIFASEIFTPILNPLEAFLTVAQSASMLTAGYWVLFHEHRETLPDRVVRQVSGACAPLLMLAGVQFASALFVAGDITVGRILWYGPQLLTFIFAGRIFVVIHRGAPKNG